MINETQKIYELISEDIPEINKALEAHDPNFDKEMWNNNLKVRYSMFLPDIINLIEKNVRPSYSYTERLSLLREKLLHWISKNGNEIKKSNKNINNISKIVFDSKIIFDIQKVRFVDPKLLYLIDESIIYIRKEDEQSKQIALYKI